MPFVPVEGPHLECTRDSTYEMGLFPCTDRSSERRGAWGSWGDRVRHRYGKHHIQKDMQFLHAHWPSSPCSTSHGVLASDTSNKVQRKYRRVMTTYFSQWSEKEKEIGSFSSEKDQRIIDEYSNLLKTIRKALPKVKKVPIRDFCAVKASISANGWRSQERMESVTLLQSLILHNRMNSRCAQGDFPGGIGDATAALSLLPPLSSHCPVPYPLEITPVLKARC